MLEVILLTPMLLASEPVRLEVDPAAYSHAAQRSVIQGGVRTAQNWPGGGIVHPPSGGIGGGGLPSRTFGGTQTFAPNGQPSDSDND